MKPKAALCHFLALAGSSLLAMSSAFAATRNWDGDTSATWATAGNWDTAPANSLLADIVNFNLATYGGNPVFAPTVGTATSINGITIGALNGAMTLTNTAALSIGDGGISIANGAGAFIISGSTTLGAAQSWTNNSANLFTFVAVTNGANLLTIGGSGNTTASGIIGNGAGGLTKEGAGLLTLNAANTYTGATTVNGGELRWGITNAIAAGALNINNGGTVNIQTFTDTVGTITLAKGGSITGTTGTLTTDSGGFISNDGGTISGFSALAGLRLKGGLTYNSTGPGSTSLQIDRVYVDELPTTVFSIADGDAAVDFEITQHLVTGSANNAGRTIRKTGAGVMQLSGSEANYTTQNYMHLDIWEGSVILNKTAGVNATGNGGTITIGDGAGVAGSAILKFNADNQVTLAGGNAITINSDGLFDLNGKTQSIGGAWTLNGTGQMDFNGGTLTAGAVSIVGTGAGANTTPIKNTAGTGSLTMTSLAITPAAGYTTSLSLGASGTLTLGGDVTFNAAGTGRAQITGSALSLGAANRILTVGLGAGAGGDLLIDAQISASGARSLTKAGAGRLTLSNTNSYTGGTTVSAGTLLLSGAFNMPGTGTLTVSNGGTFSLADGTARATTGATSGSGLNLAAGSSLAFDWNGSSLDSFTTTGTATTVAGAVAIHINNANPTGSGGTLITAASGLGTASYFLANNTNYTATISKTATTVSIGAQSSATALTNAYWLGGQVTGALGAMALSSGTTSNWASDASGTSASGVVPGGSAVNVIFGATGAAQQASVTTGADMSLGSITFNDSAAVTIGGGSVITLNSTSGTAASTSGALSTVTAGSAISVTQYSSTTTNTNTINANLLLGANQTWNIASGKTLVVSGQVAGSFGLTKADTGTVTLTGTNTYSGTTTISAGTLQIGNGSTTGSLNNNSAIVNNASLVFNRSNAVTQGADFASGISGTGSVTKAGSGTLTLSGINTYSGGTILNGGALSVNSDAALGTAGTGITVSGSTTLNSLATVSTEYNRAISLGAGTALTLTHAGANTATFSGAITGAGNLTTTLGTSGSTIALTNTANTFTGDVLATVGGNGTLRLSFNSIGDGGMLSLGKNSYTVYIQYTGASDLVLNTRRIDLNSSFSNINDGGGNPINMFENNGTGTIKFNADMTVAGSKTGTFFFGGTNTGDNTYGGVIPNSTGGTLSIGKHGAGKWILSNDNTFTGGVEVRGGTLVLSGTNSYIGQTDVQNGTLVIGSIADYGTDSAIGKGTSGVGIILGNSANTGTLVYTGGAQLTDRFIRVGINSTNSGGSTILNNGTGALTFTAANFNEAYTNANSQTRSITLGGANDGTIRGVIQNSSGTSLVSVVKIGASTWTLQGTNAFTGSTTLNAGTLKLNYDTGTGGTNTSKLADTNGILALNSGTLELSGGSHTEVVTSTTLNNGTTFIKQTGGGSSTLSMGVITYTGGALDFSAAGIANVSTSTVTNGILSSTSGTARVTVGGADWAAKDVSNNVIAYAGYTSGYAGGAMAANTNYSMVGGTTITTNRGATTNTLKITTSAASQSIAISTGSTFTLGSLLFAGAQDYAISTTGTGRIATSLLHNYGAGTLTLGSLGAALTQYGTGKTILNTAAGGDYGMNIFGGTVQFSNNLQIGTNATVKAIALNNGTLVADTTGGNIALDSSGSLSRTVSLGAGGGTLDVIGGGTLTVSGVISDTAGQFPTLTIGSASSNGTIALTGTNTYTGRTVIAGGTLSVATIGNGGVAGNLGQASNLAYNIVFDGGTLAHTGASEVSNRAFTINAGKTATIHTTNNLSLVGATGPATTGALTKTGAGTLTLTGTSTYTGGTTVSAGKLLVNNTTGSGTGTGTVSVGASATLGGTGIISGGVNVTGQLSPGASIETLATGTLSMANDSTLVHELDSFVADAVGSDLLKVTGDLNLSGTVNLTLEDLAVTDEAFAVNDTFSLINYTGSWNNGLFTFGSELLSDEEVFSFGLNTWKISYNDAEGGLNYTGEYAGGTDSFVNITAVTIIPEPGTALLGGLGILLMFRRRR